MNRLVDYAREGRPLSDVRVFDAHVHVGCLAGQDGPALAGQVEEMDRLGIDLAAGSASLAIAGEFRRGNDLVAAAVRDFPGRFLGYCFVSANYPRTMIPELERCFAIEGFKAIKVYQVGTPYDDPLYDPVWAFAADRRAPVLAHTWGGQVTGLDAAAQKNPGVAFLAAHTGSGFAYQPYIEMARRLPNFYLDLTYSREHTNMIEHIVEEVGAEQIVWGSDVPTFSMSHQLAKILFARIPDAAKRTIIYDNAARLFGLDG